MKQFLSYKILPTTTLSFKICIAKVQQSVSYNHPYPVPSWPLHWRYFSQTVQCQVKLKGKDVRGIEQNRMDIHQANHVQPHSHPQWLLNYPCESTSTTLTSFYSSSLLFLCPLLFAFSRVSPLPSIDILLPLLIVIYLLPLSFTIVKSQVANCNSSSL